jgi:hypothetical protein
MTPMTRMTRADRVGGARGELSSERMRVGVRAASDASSLATRSIALVRRACMCVHHRESPVGAVTRPVAGFVALVTIATATAATATATTATAATATSTASTAAAAAAAIAVGAV